MKRCNKPAMWYSPRNGYRACRDHAGDGMLLCAESGPGPWGLCDKPTETLRQFWARYPNSPANPYRMRFVCPYCGFQDTKQLRDGVNNHWRNGYIPGRRPTTAEAVCYEALNELKG